jgi:branched-chain amino acid transport system permease protein
LDFYDSNRNLLITAIAVLAVVLVLAWLSPLTADKPTSRLVQSTITGILIGGVYALIALGIVIINKASGVFNFAHGMMMLFGAMVFYAFFSVSVINPLAAFSLAAATVFVVLVMNGWSGLRNTRHVAIGIGAAIALTILMILPGRDFQLIRAVTGGMVGSVLTGLVVERIAIRPLIGQPLFAAVLMTLAIDQVLLGITQMIWGSVEIPMQIFGGLKDLGIPSPIRIESELIGGRVILRTELVVTFFLALVAFCAFVAFLRFNNVGLAMRATAENQQLAQSVGLRVRLILAVAWGIASLLAATAGVLQGGATSLSLNMRFLALQAFPAVLLGGLESIEGALAGGIIIGLVQEWANLLFPNAQTGTELAPYVVLMIVLVIRPDGLFGEKRIDRI